MSPDNSSISPLFGDITPDTPKSDVSKATPLSQTTSGIENIITSPTPPVSPAQAPNISPPPSTEKIPGVAPVISEAKNPPLLVSEVIAPVETPVPVSPPSIKKEEKKTIEDGKKRRYMEEDVIYQSMLRVVNAEQIRLHLAIRYLIVLFAIFLAVAWIVNNRVIMLGFSEFQWLARLRDGLFGFIGGLLALTVWFGSEVWFRTFIPRLLLRGVALAFFVAILLALYLPLW